MIDPKDTPASRTADAEYMTDERAMIATLLAGTGAMRAANTKYLPKAPAESEDAYKYRLAVSTLYNGMRRTVETLAGKPFSEPIKVGDDMPSQIAEWCDDVDMQGRDLHAFAHAVFTSALADGVSHILVEYPPVDAGAVTQAQRAVIGARPYFLHIKHDQVLGWRSERILGVETLMQLRIMEQVSEPSGQWGTKTVKQVRVLEPTTWTTFRENDKGEWSQYETGVVTLGAVPLATVYTDRTAFMQARPPLLDLAWLNIEHWQSSSDQSNILHIARVPILFAAGFEEGELKIGGAAVRNQDATAKLEYVEHSGAAIEAGRESIKDLEERMSLMGAQLLVRKPGARTATEKAIDSADADSALSLMVRTLEDSLEYALQFMADWENLGPAGEVELVGEIGGLEDMEIAGLMKARELGLLSAETVFNEMQRRGLIADDMEWKDELARLKGEGIPVAVGGSFESPNLDAMGNPIASTGVGATTPPTGTGTTQIAPPAPDFAPLLASIATLVDALNKPEAEPPQPAAPVDLSGVIEAIRAQAAPVINVTTPAITIDSPVTVNVPEQPPAQINIAPAAVTVNTPDMHYTAPTINIAPAAVTVNSPDVNVAPAAITVEGAQITNTPPVVTVEGSTINVQPAQVIQQRASGVDFTLDANGDITGAKLN